MARSERRCENDHPELAGPRSPTLVAEQPWTGTELREWRANHQVVRVDRDWLASGLVGVLGMLLAVVLPYIWPPKPPGDGGSAMSFFMIMSLVALLGVSQSGAFRWLESRRFVAADPRCLRLRRWLIWRAIPWQHIHGAEFGNRKGFVTLDGRRRVALPMAWLDSDQREDMVTFITERAHLAKIEEADEISIYGRVRLRSPGALPEMGEGSPPNAAAGSVSGAGQESALANTSLTPPSCQGMKSS